jgi:hypothetical protein
MKISKATKVSWIGNLRLKLLRQVLIPAFLLVYLFSVFHLPEEQVVVLRGVDRLTKGDIIFAVYPDTTSFYQCTVVQAPRKSAVASGQTVTVNFVDDSDEFGVTPDRPVLLKHVMLPPFGVTIE